MRTKPAMNLSARARARRREAGFSAAVIATVSGAALVLACSACSNDIDALFSAGPLPPTPWIPDAKYYAGCAQCARENCSAERDACVADPECAKLLACYGTCSDPACLSKCGPKDGWDQARQQEQGDVSNFGAPAAFPAYEACVAKDKCGGECNWGKNWDCVGNYDWPPPEDHIPIEFEANTGPGVQVRVCGTTYPDDCELLAEGQGDGWGGPILDIHHTVDTIIDYFELDVLGREDFEPIKKATLFLGEPVPHSPISRAFQLSFGLPGPRALMVTNPLLPELLDLVAGDSTGALATTLVYLMAVDCLAVPARGVHFEVVDSPPTAVPFYSLPMGQVSSVATETADPDAAGYNKGDVGGFIGLPAGFHSVRARLGVSNRRVGSRDGVRVRDREETFVIMFPDTTEGR